MLFSRKQPKLINRIDAPLEELVKYIQEGDEQLREELLRTYQPFIKKVVSKVCKRFIDQTMDEFSIGLLAFDQAINQYRDDQGSKFLTFADLVIRRRVIDFIRKEARLSRNEQFDQPELDSEDVMEDSSIHQRAAIENYENDRQIEDRVEEIQALQVMLNDFQITFEDLSKNCPKHLDARENAKQVARTLAKTPDLSEAFLQTRQLPTKDLLKYVSCSRKTIERNRKYIIAIALIYLGNFTSLTSYIEPENKD